MNGNQPANEAERDWTDGVVAIIGRRGDSGLRGPVGTGFVVSDDGLIVTCAHVVDQTEWPYGQWDVPIQVRFKASGRYGNATVQEGCILPDLDLAVLRLPDGLPDGVVRLKMVGSEGATGHTTRMWGFPAKYERGLLGEGTFQGKEGRQQLQITSSQTTHGYSGSPVWDEVRERVIGMITSGSIEDEIGRLQYESFALPAEAMVEACPELLKLTPLGADEGFDMSGYDNRPLLSEMKRVFSLGDLEDLAFQLQIEFADLPGSTKSAKVRELILYCERRDRIPDLLQAMCDVKDNKVDWFKTAGVTKL